MADIQITGTDGKVPVYQPEGRWTIWNINEIYMGGPAAGRYVPKVNDYVKDVSTDQSWRVESLDQVTLVPTLVPVITVQVGEFSELDVLLGVGPGTQSDTYRIYIDKSVIPYTLDVDARLYVAGSMVATAKIFKGSLLTGNEKCISALYDNSGTLVSQAIPLETVSEPNGVNYSIRTVPVCNTTEDLADGEIVTVVFYSDLGHVVSKRQLLVENTAFIRSTDKSVKYITGIALDSPFLSNSDPKLIQYPLNVPLSGMNLMGIVNYSDGSSLRMPVDGTKFSVFGFENFVSTIIGQKFPVVLKYTLSPGEIVYGASVAGDRFMTETFTATTMKAEGVYSLKLYVVPVWVDAVVGYRLRWFMYSLDRNIAMDVTHHVMINANSAAFDPTAYGVNQHLNVSINLKDVNPGFKNYTHVQTVEIALSSQGTERVANWNIAYEPNQQPRYGADNHVSTTFFNQNLMKIKLDMGLTNIQDWLKRVYYDALPLVDMDVERVAPEPTHFVLMVGNDELIYPITQWNATLTLNTVLENSSTLVIRFVKQLPDGNVELGLGAMPVWQTN